MAEEEGREEVWEIPSQRRTQCSIPGLKMEGDTWERMQRVPKAGSKPWLTASKEMQILVLQMQQTNSANNRNKPGNGFVPRASRDEPSPANTLAL